MTSSQDPARTREVRDLSPLTRCYTSADGIPNHPTLPTVLVKGAVLPDQSADAMIALLAVNGWGGNWHGTVFDYHHYHPNAHETLIAVSGQAQVQLGGPSGDVFDVISGDVMVLPAGTGHCRLSGSDDFSVCGGYPKGQENYEIVRANGAPLDEELARITAVPLPLRCPIFAETGPLMAAWPG